MKLIVDLSDLEGSRKLMDELGDSKTPFVGRNDCGETTHTSISHESIVIETYQDNGWIRQNWLHYDGTREEIFDGRWNSKVFKVTLELSAESEQAIHGMIDKLIDSDKCLSYSIEEE